MTVGTYTSAGFKEIDGTNMPGWYQFCPPNSALASGAKSVGFHLKGATNMAPLPIEVDLDSQVDVTSWNGTAVSSPATAGIPDVNVKNINNVAAATPGASGGILISGSNSGTTTLGALTVSGATTLAALSCTTLTASGAVAFQSTFGVTGALSLSSSLTITGQLTISNGIDVSCTTADRDAVLLTGNGAGSGLSLVSGNGSPSYALKAAGRSGSLFTGTAGNPAVTMTGGSTGPGLKLIGGSTSGESLLCTTTSGNAITLTPTAGHGISATGNGTSMHGVVLTGGTAGTSDGLKLVAGTGGVGFRLDTLTSSGAVTFNSLTVSGATTFTGAWTATNGGNSITGVTASVTGTVTLASSQTFNNTGTWTGNLTGSVGSVTGLTASNLDTTVSSRMATYTQPTGFLAATFPTTVSSLTQTQVTGGAYSVQSVSCVLGDARIADLDATVSSRASATVAPSWYTTPVGASVDVSSINGVSTSSVTTVNAVLGTATVGSTAAALSTAQTGITTLLVGVNLNASQHVIVDSGIVTTVTNQLTAAQIATGVWQDATAGDFTTASSIGKSLYTGGFVPGDTSGGLVRNNAVASFSALAVNGSTTLNTLTVIGTTLFNGAWTATNAGNSVTGITATVGAVDVASINGVSTASVTTVNAVLGTATAGSTASALATAQSGITTLLTGVNLNADQHVIVDSGTITTYTGNTPQTGDAFARIGATGSGLTSLAPSSTALTSATWTNGLATNLGTLAGHDPGSTLASATGVSGVPAATVAYDIGNGRTVGYFLQGGANAVSFAADGLSFTVFGTDDTTTLYTGTSTRLSTTIGGLRAIDPT